MIFGLKGNINTFPIISRTGKTFRINLITKTNIAYFQLSKNNATISNQSAQKTSTTHFGGIGSSEGKVPFRFACVILISNVVIAEVIAYKIVITIIIGELMAVLNNSNHRF